MKTITITDEEREELKNCKSIYSYLNTEQKRIYSLLNLLARERSASVYCPVCNKSYRNIYTHKQSTKHLNILNGLKEINK